MGGKRRDLRSYQIDILASAGSAFFVILYLNNWCTGIRYITSYDNWYIRNSKYSTTHSTAQHRTAQHHIARQSTAGRARARRCAAELSSAGSDLREDEEKARKKRTWAVNNAEAHTFSKVLYSKEICVSSQELRKAERWEHMARERIQVGGMRDKKYFCICVLDARS